MIITQTPFRMSFFGGGTDMESFFRENGGAVLSATYYKWKSRQGKLNRYEQDRILLTQLLHEEHELHPCGMGGEKRLRKPVYLLRNETMPQKQCANTQKINKNLGNI